MDRRGELRAAHLFASRALGRRGDRRLEIRHSPASPYSDKGRCFVIFEYPFVIYLAAPNFLAFDLRTCPATSTNSAIGRDRQRLERLIT